MDEYEEIFKLENVLVLARLTDKALKLSRGEVTYESLDLARQKLFKKEQDAFK